jgi:hypothetical protein
MFVLAGRDRRTNVHEPELFCSKLLLFKVSLFYRPDSIEVEALLLELLTLSLDLNQRLFFLAPDIRGIEFLYCVKLGPLLSHLRLELLRELRSLRELCLGLSQLGLAKAMRIQRVASGYRDHRGREYPGK